MAAVHLRWPDTPREVCESDVNQVLSELADAQLIREAGDPSDR